MNKAELMKALKNLKVQTGSLACLGCGHEYSCSTKGCAIIRAAVEELSSSPLSIGDTVYYVVRDNNWRVVEEKVAEVGVNGFFISNVKGGMEPDDYIPYADIGNEWFLSKEEAEQMAKTRKAEKCAVTAPIGMISHLMGDALASKVNTIQNIRMKPILVAALRSVMKMRERAEIIWAFDKSCGFNRFAEL